MRLQVKGKNMEVTPSLREYVERKIAKLGKQLAEPTQVEVELSELKNPSIAASNVAEGTIFTKGPTLRAHESSTDMKAAIDQLADKLERQVKRYRERRIVEPRRHTAHRRRRGSLRRDAFWRRRRCTASWPSGPGSREGLDPPSSTPARGLAADPPGFDGEARGEAGIHGVPRRRQWDAVATVEAPALRVTPCISRRSETERSSSTRTSRPRRSCLSPMPSSGAWRRRTGRRPCGGRSRDWAVAARRIELVEVPGLPGEDAELVVTRGRPRAASRRPGRARTGAGARTGRGRTWLRVRRPAPAGRR